MQLSKKWQELGWSENNDFTMPSYRRVIGGKIQLVIQTPNKKMWRAVWFDENQQVTSEISYPTLPNALASFDIKYKLTNIGKGVKLHFTTQCHEKKP